MRWQKMNAIAIDNNNNKNNDYNDWIIDNKDDNDDDNNNNDEDVNKEVNNGGSKKGTIFSWRTLPSDWQTNTIQGRRIIERATKR